MINHKIIQFFYRHLLFTANFYCLIYKFSELETFNWVRPIFCLLRLIKIAPFKFIFFISLIVRPLSLWLTNNAQLMKILIEILLDLWDFGIRTRHQLSQNLFINLKTCLQICIQFSYLLIIWLHFVFIKLKFESHLFQRSAHLCKNICRLSYFLERLTFNVASFYVHLF